MKTVVTSAGTHSKAATSAGMQASDAAGDPRVASAVTALARALAKAAADTSTSVSDLGEVATTTAANLAKATGK
ncbi:hypothetical protein [Streptomyces sp. NBC_00078]|uniref:hypothetical protein n=1 Tax=unclassified Streptomyces TaxID=2593676 RepID=UPI00224C9DD1|nr:hypothetical protein [Streptomyces sp. NBC_00078]MCX5422881.1 hypothetical protein [Streptomyces sp. NBC_00078]